jgi:hypothetical protein
MLLSQFIWQGRSNNDDRAMTMAMSRSLAFRSFQQVNIHACMNKRVSFRYLIVMAMLLSGLNVTAQKVAKVKYASQADIKVYVVDYESQCDLKVFHMDYASQANKDGLWFSVDYESQADYKVFFVDYESQADLKIYYVDYPSQAGWKNKSKAHILKF